jgi:hypothetical protein
MAGTDRRSGRRIKREFLWKLQERDLAWRRPLVCGSAPIVHDRSCAEDVIPDAFAQILHAWPHEVRLTKNGAKEDLALLMRMGLTGRAPAPQTLSEPAGLIL